MPWLPLTRLDVKPVPLLSRRPLLPARDVYICKEDVARGLPVEHSRNICALYLGRILTRFPDGALFMLRSERLLCYSWLFLLLQKSPGGLALLCQDPLYPTTSTIRSKSLLAIGHRGRLRISTGSPDASLACLHSAAIRRLYPTDTRYNLYDASRFVHRIVWRLFICWNRVAEIDKMDIHRISPPCKHRRSAHALLASMYSEAVHHEVERGRHMHLGWGRALTGASAGGSRPC